MQPSPTEQARFRAIALSLLCLLFLAGVTQADDPGERRVVAVGDIHGAYGALVDILRETALIDAEKNWIGGDAILVQTGDYMDRGIGTRKVVELLIELEAQAPDQGGEVIALLGNHEVFNLIGVRRDVTPDILASFSNPRSTEKRERVCKAWSTEGGQGEGKEPSDPLKQAVAVQRCLMRHPPGLMEYVQELGPEGRMGAWLRQRPVAAKVGDVVFLHGGISPMLRGRSLEDINSRVWQEIAILDQVRAWLVQIRRLEPTAPFLELVKVARESFRNVPMEELKEDPPSERLVFPEDLAKLNDLESWLIHADDGPVWFRGYAQWTEKEGRREMPKILDALDAEHVVVGHTPQSPRSIRSRFEDQVFLIDTGMLGSVYEGGRAAALEIRGERFKAIYPSEEVVLIDPGPGVDDATSSNALAVGANPER